MGKYKIKDSIKKEVVGKNDRFIAMIRDRGISLREGYEAMRGETEDIMDDFESIDQESLQYAVVS